MDRGSKMDRVAAFGRTFRVPCVSTAPGPNGYVLDAKSSLQIPQSVPKLWLEKAMGLRSVFTNGRA